MKPDISITIPFFNAGEHFSHCLDSIVNQTFQNFEVLLIDDGSTDHSAEVCHSYTTKDQRFKYHFKQNGGVSSARNLGVELAEGKYLAFIDSDDFVNPDFCSVLFGIAEEKQIDILNFGHSYIKEGMEVLHAPVFGDQVFVSRGDLLKVLKKSASNRFLYFCWSRFYRRDFMNEKKVRFNEKSLLGSDSLFNLEAFLNADRIYSVNFYPYHYIYNTSSLTQRKFKENLIQKYETQFVARINIQSQHTDAWTKDFRTDIANNYIQNALFMLLFNVRNSSGDKIKEMAQIRNSPIFKFSFENYGTPQGITLMMKFKIFLFRYRMFSVLNLLNK